MSTLKPQCNWPLGLYSNTVIRRQAVDWWAVTFGTARRGLGGLRPRPVPSSLYVSKASTMETFWHHAQLHSLMTRARSLVSSADFDLSLLPMSLAKNAAEQNSLLRRSAYSFQKFAQFEGMFEYRQWYLIDNNLIYRRNLLWSIDSNCAWLFFQLYRPV